MLAGEWTDDAEGALAGEVERAAVAIQLHVLNAPILDARDGNSEFGGAGFQYARGLGALRREHSRNAGFEYARLLARDCFKARAEIGFVIEIDRRDYAKLRLHDVG